MAITAQKSRVPHLRALAEVGIRLSTPALLLVLLSNPAVAQQSLYAQSIQTALAARTPGLEILLLDLRTHETLANTFHSPATPIPAGSLLKPFLALAYAHSHTAPPPAVVCHGHPDRCWKDGGHGAITLTEAVAQSCNAFFLALARDVKPADIPYLPPPPQNPAPETLIGLTPDWRISPEALVQAYAALLAAPPSPTQTSIREGMAQSARHGTANRIGPHPGGVLAKTGTAPCVDLPCKASGDGLVIAAVPAAHPTLLLLVRKRATTGAMTALAAGPILTQLESLHAE
jgi:cell division protein FtsI/penicillin-binding protein 2